MEQFMENFVNRDYELKHIDEAIDALQDKNSLLRTPIIELYGVGGIGKSSLLTEVEQRCTSRRLPCIRVNINKQVVNFSQQIIKQARQYSDSLPSSDPHQDHSALIVTRSLMQHSPVVLLLDAVDSASTDVLTDIELLLRDLIEDEKLFVVLTSKKMLPFQSQRSIARKLTMFQLQSLDRASCEEYATTAVHINEPAIRNLIFEWTRGYPAAMNVMVQAINEDIDPRQEEGKRTIFSRFLEQVIYQEILSEVSEEKRDRYRSALQLLSVPRRFNLVIMQDLIEHFAPGLRRESSLAYFGLPREINETTDVLNWNLIRAGFAVDTPVRNLMLLLLQFEQPEYYFQVHHALYENNLELSNKVTGTDRIRYLRECLYHIASETNATDQRERLQAVMARIEQEPPETFQQFYEEFSQDDELKEALGSYLPFIHTRIYTTLARMNRQSAQRSTGHDRVRLLKEYVFYTARSFTFPDEIEIFQQVLLKTVKNRESQEVQHALSTEIVEDERVRVLFGKDADRFLEVIGKALSKEG
jgi:hypothetical protein